MNIASYEVYKHNKNKVLAMYRHEDKNNPFLW